MIGGGQINHIELMDFRRKLRRAAGGLFIVSRVRRYITNRQERNPRELGSKLEHNDARHRRRSVSSCVGSAYVRVRTVTHGKSRVRHNDGVPNTKRGPTDRPHLLSNESISSSFISRLDHSSERVGIKKDIFQSLFSFPSSYLHLRSGEDR